MLKLNGTTNLRSKFLALGFALALCLSGSSLAAQNSHITTTGATDAAGGIAITNQANMTYTFAGAAASTSTNIVTVYVNQINAFYITPNDTAQTVVRTTDDVVTGMGVAITFTNSVVNQSNGPITLTMGTSAKGYLGSALTPVLSAATYQATATYYSFTATGTGVTQSGTTVGSTMTIPQNTTATLVVTVTPPATGLSAGGWDEFVTTLTDATTAALVNSGNAANFTVTQYNSSSALWTTYLGLDTQVTSEVDIANNANFGKLQLLDPTCGGTAFFTTSVSGNVRTTTSASFPAASAIVWNHSGAQVGQPVTGTTGLLAVSANPAECIAYEIVLNNPLSVGSIPSGAAISDTLTSNATLVPAKTTLTGVTGAIGTANPLVVTTSAVIPALGNVVIFYEALVK
jgi:hypothetical protein